MDQRSFASSEYAVKKEQTRREKLLSEMDQVVPWLRLIAVIKPFFPTRARIGRPPIGVSKMLRLCCLQQCYGLDYEAQEDAIYDSQALRDFVGIDLSRESVPDATTPLMFGRLFNENDLTRALFEELNKHLAAKGLLMRSGTIVDATIIAAPPSTKNREKAGDTEMHQMKKGRLALRDDGAYRLGRRLRAGSYRGGHAGTRGRCNANARASARRGIGGGCRRGLPGRANAKGVCDDAGDLAGRDKARQAQGVR